MLSTGAGGGSHRVDDDRGVEFFYRFAESYVSAKRCQVKFVCTRHKSAKDLRPLYRVAQPQSTTPTLPLATEEELLIPGNVRLKITKIREEPLDRGKRITITCEEED